MVFLNRLERIVARLRPPVSFQSELEILFPDLRVTSKLGEGGYGTVFEALDRDLRRLALKVQVRRSKIPSELKKEFKCYRAALARKGFRTIPSGIPSVYEYKEHNGHDFMLMERLGESLAEIMDKSLGMKLGKADVLKLGIQVVQSLRGLHERGILHRDVKPENLVMGHGGDKDRTVYIIDFGLGLFVKDYSKCNYNKHVEFSGTRNYASVEALYSLTPSRVGDLESLAYTLLRLACGELPWTFFDEETGRRLTDLQLGDQRFEFEPAELCKDFPELTEFFSTIIRTKRALKPDYERLISLLEKALEDIGSKKDGNFSWLENKTTIKSKISACVHSKNGNRKPILSPRGNALEICSHATERFEQAPTCRSTASENTATTFNRSSMNRSRTVDPEIISNGCKNDKIKTQRKEEDNRAIRRDTEVGQDSVQIQKNLVRPLSRERTTKYRRGRSRLEAAAGHLCSTDHQSHNDGDESYGEASATIPPRGGRKRDFLKLLSKGVAGTVRTFSRGRRSKY